MESMMGTQKGRFGPKFDDHIEDIAPKGKTMGDLLKPGDLERAQPAYLRGSHRSPSG